MNPRRLTRSRDRQLAGVAGGMAEYLDVDPTVIRILWILAVIFTAGLAILAYIVLAFVMPEASYAAAAYPAGYPAGYPAPPAPGAAGAWGQPATAAPTWSPDYAANAAATQARQRSQGRGLGAAAIIGMVLVVIGAIAFVDAVFPGWSGAVILGPSVIIALGVGLLATSIRRRDDVVEAPVAAAPAPAAPVAAEPPVADAAVDPELGGHRHPGRRPRLTPTPSAPLAPSGSGGVSTVTSPSVPQGKTIDRKEDNGCLGTARP